MAYVPPKLTAIQPVNATISMFTEEYLKQAHYLLAATYPADGPFNHFGQSAAVMTLLAIAAASRLRIFDPVKNDKRPGTSDRAAFLGCVREFFPWSDVTIVDDLSHWMSENGRSSKSNVCLRGEAVAPSRDLSSQPASPPPSTRAIHLPVDEP
jgi:hypothetical protein